MDNRYSALARAYSLNKAMNARTVDRAVRHNHVTHDKAGIVSTLHFHKKPTKTKTENKTKQKQDS